MSFYEWFHLIVIHILIPAIVVFFIIFYIWRFLAFIREQFRKMKERVDGKTSDGNYKEHVRSKEQSILITRSKRGKNNTLHGHDGKSESEKIYSRIYYQNNRRPLALDQKIIKEGLKIFTNESYTGFNEWYDNKMSVHQYDDIIYVSPISIGEQFEYFSKNVSPLPTGAALTEVYFEYYCLFFELRRLEELNYVTWEQNKPVV